MVAGITYIPAKAQALPREGGIGSCIHELFMPYAAACMCTAWHINLPIGQGTQQMVSCQEGDRGDDGHCDQGRCPAAGLHTEGF